MKTILAFRPKILDVLKGYSKDKFVKDLVAGVIVGVVALPLCIAFGIASGVSPEQGLITGIVAGFVVSLLGGSIVQIAGPTGAFIIIVYGTLSQYGMSGLALSSIMAGIMLILLGLCRLGSFIKFIPYPIIVGFNTGIAISIFSTQIKDFFGLTMDKVPVDFLSKWSAYFHAADTFSYISIIIAVVTIILIRVIPRINNKIPSMLLAIIIVTVISYLLRNFTTLQGITTIGDRFTINASMPMPQGVPVSMSAIIELFPVAFTIAILGAIVSLMSATVADGAVGERHDSNTELVAQGAACIIVPFFGGIPPTGAIARTMTSINNGGRTPIAGIVHALVLLIIFLFLGPLTTHIPVACLAGVLVLISYNMGDWRTIVELARNNKSESVVLFTTLVLTVVVNLSTAIQVGLLLALVMFIRRISSITTVSVATGVLDLSNENERSHEDEKLIIPSGVEVYEIDGPFFFGVANKFDQCMREIGEKSSVRIIRMRKVPLIDATGVHNLTSLYKLSAKENIQFILSGVNPKVRETLQSSQLYNMIGEENICDSIDQALARATELLEKCDANNTCA
ncbi:MAG: SulP family inorganic anion transporter [Marinifilaceae bacterium]